MHLFDGRQRRRAAGDGATIQAECGGAEHGSKLQRRQLPPQPATGKPPVGKGQGHDAHGRRGWRAGGLGGSAAALGAGRAAAALR